MEQNIIKKQTFFVMEYFELDKLVNDNIPSAQGKYEFISETEANNYACYKFEDVGKQRKNTDPESYYRKYSVPAIESGKRFDSILEYLCEKDIIPAGDYLITVYW